MPKNNFTSIVKKKIDTLSYNKLYMEYKNSNTKYAELYNNLINNADKLKERETEKLLKQIEKEQKKIDDSLKKMEKFPDLKRGNEQIIQIDMQAREHEVNRYNYKKVEIELMSIRNNIKSEADLLKKTQANIMTLQSLVDSYPTPEAYKAAELDNARRRKKENEDLLKAKQEAQRLLKTNPNNQKAQNDLHTINYQLRLNRDTYEEARRADSSNDIKTQNLDHLEYYKDQEEKIRKAITQYKNQEIKLNEKLTTLKDKQNAPKNKIDSYKPQENTAAIDSLQKSTKHKSSNKTESKDIASIKQDNIQSVQISDEERAHKVDLDKHKQGEITYTNILSTLKKTKDALASQYALLKTTEANITQSQKLVDSNSTSKALKAAKEKEAAKSQQEKEIHQKIIQYQNEEYKLRMQIDNLNKEQKKLQEKIDSYNQKKNTPAIDPLQNSNQPISSDKSANKEVDNSKQEKTVKPKIKDSKELQAAVKSFNSSASLATTQNPIVTGNHRHTTTRNRLGF